MSHELRTPLNSIIGFSDMLLSEIYGAIENQRYLEYLGDINASGRHLLDLINNILDVSKIEAGAMDMADEEVKIAAAADACLSMVKERAVRAGVSLECNIPADLPSVRGDALRIKQVLLNLIGNAIKFTPSGGHVMVTAGLRDGGVFVTISDTGIGIAEEDLKRVTEPFSQAAKGMTRNYEGTGLGLSLVKSMMALHEGKFSIESVLSQGTEVTIQFPKHRTILPDQIKTTA
jgi:signal transduction histidine kinase